MNQAQGSVSRKKKQSSNRAIPPPLCHRNKITDPSNNTISQQNYSPFYQYPLQQFQQNFYKSAQFTEFNPFSHQQECPPQFTGTCSSSDQRQLPIFDDDNDDYVEAVHL
jgi:hypothetical protein